MVKQKRNIPLIYLILWQQQSFSDVLTLHILRVDRHLGVLAKEWSKRSTANGDKRGIEQALAHPHTPRHSRARLHAHSFLRSNTFQAAARDSTGVVLVG